MDFGRRPNDGTGVLATWRAQAAPAGLGFRFALTLPEDDRTRASGGVDVAVPMLARSESFPLDVIWISGLGAAYGDYLAVGLRALALGLHSSLGR